MKAVVVWGNLIVCGCIAVFISFFFAEGTIAENYTHERFVAPEFFFILPVWTVGALLVGWYFYKSSFMYISYIKIILISLLLWLTIPGGLWFSSLFS
ncbi:hypothetical protein ACFOLA_04255 [Salinicoccus hispanicus]|uniref:Uncharacterized protein n=1 Tax=Salinicoccus hispanicus TaxID=157225 RepID=A0A6N8U4H8_9STAP|nr:hypothetical protein [Salinicoccus hispanicus]MXQ52026.1 hypothetical protein [Salinicoccus hispanicus]